MCPSPVSGGMGFAPVPEAPDPAPARTEGTLKPCRGRAPELPSGALESPRRGHGSRVARGLLQPPSTGSGEPEHAATPEQLAPPPASCSAAPQQYGRLARSEATRRRRSAEATKLTPPIELYLQWITLGAQIGGLRSATDKQEARAGVAWAWGARPAYLLYMLPSALQAGTSQLRHGPGRPLRLASDAAMFTC